MASCLLAICVGVGAPSPSRPWRPPLSVEAENFFMARDGAANAIQIATAVNDLKNYDLAIDLIGSRAVDLANEDSNVNVLITMPLKALIKAVQEQTPPIYCIVDPPRWSRLHSIQLMHLSTGVELEVTSRWSADFLMRERDDLMRLLCEADERVPTFLKLIGAWYSRYKAELPPEAGFPSRYVFRLLGLHFLMAMTGPLLPPLAPTGPRFNTAHPTWKAAKKAGGVSAEDLFQEWLKMIIKSEKRGLIADLRDPYQAGDKIKWRVVDPAAKEDAANFKLKPVGQEVSKPSIIVMAAKRELAARAEQT